MSKEEISRLRIELPPLIKTKEGYHYFTLVLYIREDKPGIFTDVIERIRKRVERANIRWSLGNSQIGGKALVILIFEVPENEIDKFRDVLNEIKELDYVEKLMVDESPHDVGVYAPRRIEIAYDFNGARTVVISADFLNRMVEAIGQGGDPIITSLVNTTLYRTSYFRGFSMAEELKTTLFLEGKELVDAVLREFKALGYFSDYSLNEIDGNVEIEFKDLVLMPSKRIENPLILGTIAGILDSAYGSEFKVEITDFKKVSSESYHAKLLCKPVEEPLEESSSEESRGKRRRSFLRRRQK